MHSGEGQREREFQADSVLNVEPDVGFDLTTLRSGTKTTSRMLNRLCLPGAPRRTFRTASRLVLDEMAGPAAWTHGARHRGGVQVHRAGSCWPCRRLEGGDPPQLCPGGEWSAPAIWLVLPRLLPCSFQPSSPLGKVLQFPSRWLQGSYTLAGNISGW